MGSNYTELPVPDRKIITKNNVELKSGHMNMLPRMTTGNAWQQHRQLQMLKGMYKTTMCMHERSRQGCEKKELCCFAHTTDNDAKIDAEVVPLRFDVYTKLFEDGFSLPKVVLYEIGQMVKEEYQTAMRKQAHHEDLVAEQAAAEAEARPPAQRLRMHDNSRSPKGSPSDRNSTTPDPNRRGLPENYSDFSGFKKRYKGKGDVSAMMEVDDDSSARQRDLASGGADEDEGSDREDEAVAPIDNDSKELSPPKEEPRSLSPCDDDGNIEPTPQPAGETDDTDMTRGLPEVSA